MAWQAGGGGQRAAGGGQQRGEGGLGLLTGQRMGFGCVVLFLVYRGHVLILQRTNSFALLAYYRSGDPW